jgi:hypothetical protein
VSTDWAGPDEGWRDVLEGARRRWRDPTSAQRVWDDAWNTNWRTARGRGHSDEAAVEIADTRTEAQRGQRPTNPKETQR